METTLAERYDVAISFVAADEPVAMELRKALDPPYSAFVYSKAQEQLAGRDGIEAFRTVFSEKATLVVILFRLPWGETPWTRVEKMAIEEFALAAGWEHLMFVRLSDAPVPKWVPKPHLYLDYNRYSMADLVGAVKARLLELGVEAAPVTPAQRAVSQARQAAFDEQTRNLLNDSPNEYVAAMNALFEAIKVEAAAVAEATGWKMVMGPGALIGGFVVSGRGQGLHFACEDRYANTARDTVLRMSEYDMELFIQEPNKRYSTIGRMQHVRARRIDIQRLPELGWCWEFEGHVRPVAATAEAIVHVLLDRIAAADAKQLSRR